MGVGAAVSLETVYFALFDDQGRLAYTNGPLREALAGVGDLSALTLGDLLAVNGVPGSQVLASLEEAGTWSGDAGLCLPGRGQVPVRLELVTCPAAGGGAAAIALLARSRTGAAQDRDPSRERLRRRQDMLMAIIEESPDFVSTADAQGRVLFYNRAARRMLGIGEDEDLSGIRIPDTHPEWVRDLVMQEALPAAARDGVWTGETCFLSRDGREIPVLQTIVAHRNEDGQVEYFSTIAVDISERKRYEEELARLVNRDQLTGLLNRAGLQAELERRLQASGDDAVHVLLYIDLDNLKDVNDSLGHHAGDALIKKFAALLDEVFGPTGVTARIGGDEFAVFLPGTCAVQAQVLAAQLLERLQGDVVVAGKGVIKPNASIGIAEYPRHGGTTDELLVSADLAMYEAKNHGGGRMALFSPDLQVGKEISSRVTWEQRIREALSQDRLILYRQPIQNLRTGRVAFYELLLRMPGPDGRVVGPDAFLDVAARTPLMAEIDLWVVRRALAMLDAPAGPDVALTVNLSGRSLSDEGFMDALEAELQRRPRASRLLVLEITEQSAIGNLPRVQQHIQRLQGLGCRFALDDFGVGFACFDLLRRLPVDLVKIDGSFIRNLSRSAADRRLLKGVVEIAGALGKATVAEFVEDEETLEFLRGLGVDYAQGFFIGRPEPAPVPGTAAPAGLSD